MFGQTPTYHGIVRNAIVGFGNFFSNIYIERRKDNSVSGEVVQKLKVPLSFSNKEKWVMRLQQDASLENQLYTTLPRMAFEIVGYNYDSARKVGKMQTIRCGNNQVFSPVPYIIDLNYYIITKTQEDGLQILEQILPVFSPDYTISIKSVAALNIYQDVPIILGGVSLQDDYEGDFQMRRFVTYTLTFQMKINLFGATQQPGNIILKSMANISTTDINNSDRKFTAIGDEDTGEVLFEDWE